MKQIKGLASILFAFVMLAAGVFASAQQAPSLPAPQIVKPGDINNELFTVVEEAEKFSTGRNLQTIAFQFTIKVYN